MVARSTSSSPSPSSRPASNNACAAQAAPPRPDQSWQTGSTAELETQTHKNTWRSRAPAVLQVGMVARLCGAALLGFEQIIKSRFELVVALELALHGLGRRSRGRKRVDPVLHVTVPRVASRYLLESSRAPPPRSPSARRRCRCRSRGSFPGRSSSARRSARECRLAAPSSVALLDLDHSDHRTTRAFELRVPRGDREFVDRVREEAHLFVGDSEVVVRRTVRVGDLCANAFLELREDLIDVDLVDVPERRRRPRRTRRYFEYVERVERRGDVERAIVAGTGPYDPAASSEPRRARPRAREDARAIADGSAHGRARRSEWRGRRRSGPRSAKNSASSRASSIPSTGGAGAASAGRRGAPRGSRRSPRERSGKLCIGCCPRSPPGRTDHRCGRIGRFALDASRRTAGTSSKS